MRFGAELSPFLRVFLPTHTPLISFNHDIYFSDNFFDIIRYINQQYSLAKSNEDKLPITSPSAILGATQTHGVNHTLSHIIQGGGGGCILSSPQHTHRMIDFVTFYIYYC